MEAASEFRVCTGTCGPDGKGRELPLTDEFFYRRTGKAGFVRLCKDCILSRQRAQMRAKAAGRKANLDTVPPENRARREVGESYWGEETAVERSLRLVDTLLPRLPWEQAP